jgi:hypothetical protein
MTHAYAAPEDRITLDMIVARLNVERFSKMLSEEADQAKRQTLAHLISEEKAKLDALFPLRVCLRTKRCTGPSIEELNDTCFVVKTLSARSSRTFISKKSRGNEAAAAAGVDTAGVRPTSALPPKADIDHDGGNVRFVPKADILRCGKERRYSITSSATDLDNLASG